MERITPAKRPMVLMEVNLESGGKKAPIIQSAAAAYIGYRKFLFVKVGAWKKKLAPIKT